MKLTATDSEVYGVRCGVGAGLEAPPTNAYPYLTVSLVEYVGPVAWTVHPPVEYGAWGAAGAAPAGDILTVPVVGVTAERVSESLQAVLD